MTPAERARRSRAKARVLREMDKAETALNMARSVIAACGRRTGPAYITRLPCLTVAEYNALGIWLHRTVKHPAISLLVLPPLIFLVLYRFPFSAPRTWRAERRSVHLTNLSLVALYAALAAMLGVGPVAAVLLAVIVPASTVGVWLFSLQQHFDGTH
jgi:acyl-lipid omega-6 desaturase (Delta-12 desaturase)